jgi:hypothetical protein
MRYCVLSIPRTGSSWLLNGIAFNLYNVKNFINLDEFFTPFVDDKHYEVNATGLICAFKEEKTIIEISKNDFINSRLDILSRGSKNQSVIIKYMYWPNQVTDDIEHLKKIKEYGFKIVNINRDPFDSTISLLVAIDTGVAHHWNTNNEYWYSTINGKQKNIIAPNITLDTYKFEVLYTEFLLAYDTKQKMAEEIDCVTVNYQTLKSDCTSNMIPFNSTPGLLKLYDLPYSSMITNYDQLLTIKSKIDNSIT